MSCNQDKTLVLRLAVTLMEQGTGHTLDYQVQEFNGDVCMLAHILKPIGAIAKTMATSELSKEQARQEKEMRKEQIEDNPFVQMLRSVGLDVEAMMEGETPDDDDDDEEDEDAAPVAAENKKGSDFPY